MKIKTSIMALAAALTLVGASQAHAQQLDQNGPLGNSGWSSSAPLCKILPGSAASAVNYSAPSFMTFAPNSYGTIGLICNMNGITNGLTPLDMNAIAFSFSNPNPEAGCTATVQLVDRTTATPVYYWTTGRSTNYKGIWTVNTGSPSRGSLYFNHTYDVEMYLSRPQSAVNSCNPIAYAAFLEDWIF